MKTLKIYNYEILNFESDPIIYTSAGLTKITNKQMSNVLKRIKGSSPEHLQQDELEQILKNEKLEPNTAIDFLKSICVIGEEIQRPHFNDTTIYTDLNIPESHREFLTNKYEGKLKISPVLPREPIATAHPTLTIFAYMKISPEALREAYTKILDNNPENGASIGFVSGNDFHLTEVHIPAIGNPCAFCTLDRIAYYETIRGSNHHWSKVWSFCRSAKLDLPKADIDELQCLLILGAIISFTNKLTKPAKRLSTQDQVLASRTLNLANGALTEDSSVHWPFCKCLGAKI